MSIADFSITDLSITDLSTVDLAVFYLGGSFIIALAWAATMGEALIGTGHRGARTAVGALALLGLVHPLAAIASFDLVRLNRTVGDAAPLYRPWWTAATTTAIAIGGVTTLAVWAQTGVT